MYLNSLRAPRTFNLKNKLLRDSIQSLILIESLQLAHNQGLNAVLVDGCAFRDQLLASTWILVNDPELGIVTFDPFYVWENPDIGSTGGLRDSYIITESCFRNPIKSKWVAQILRKKNGGNPVTIGLNGVDFMALTIEELPSVYTTRQKGGRL